MSEKTVSQEDLLKKIALLQEKISKIKSEDKRFWFTPPAIAGTLWAGSNVVDSMLDSAIWAVDTYYNVPP